MFMGFHGLCVATTVYADCYNNYHDNEDGESFIMSLATCPAAEHVVSGPVCAVYIAMLHLL